MTGVGGIEIYDGASLDLTIAAGTAGAIGESSEFSATYAMTKAFDHSTTTAWRSASGDAGWLRYDLGSIKDVRSLIFRNWNGAGEPPQSVTVYSSTTAPPVAGTPYLMDTLLVLSALDTTANTANSTTLAVGASVAATYATPVMNVASGRNRHTVLAPATFGLGHVMIGGKVLSYLINFGGLGYIEGVTEVFGLPDVPSPFKRVGIYRQTGQFITSQTSGADGSYRFNGLNLSMKYFVVAWDDSHNYRAVIKDNIAAVHV